MINIRNSSYSYSLWWLTPIFIFLLSSPLGCGNDFSSEQNSKETFIHDTKNEIQSYTDELIANDLDKEKPSPDHPTISRESSIGLDSIITDSLDGGNVIEKRSSLDRENTLEGRKNEVLAGENLREIIPEQLRDSDHTMQVTAISLLASFLGKNPQAGLMKQISKNKVWELLLRVQKGLHQLSFRFNTQSLQSYGVSPSFSTWPITGSLKASNTTFSLSFPSDGLYLFRVDLSQLKYSIKKQLFAQSVRVEGMWNGKIKQQAILTRGKGGFFQKTFNLQPGLMKWHFALLFGTRWQNYGVRYQARKTFPQGGELILNGKESLSKIPFAGNYLIRYRPHEKAYTLALVPDQPSITYQTIIRRLSQATTQAARQTLLKTFFLKQSFSGGLPLLSGNRAIFVLQWKAKAPVYLSGSFNQWSSKTHPMLRIAGTDIYHLSIKISSGYHNYKFTDSSAKAQWLTDPQNPRFEYGPYGPNSTFQVGASSKGILYSHSNITATLLKNKRSIFVYLPPNYHKDLSRRYPVLYMHDGQNLFDPKAFHGGWGVDKWIEKLSLKSSFDPPIVVGIANTSGRMDEYTHVQESYSGIKVGGRALDYADFLLREVKPMIDGIYRTLPAGRYTGVMGSSLGGLISLWLGFKYPESFYRIGALSSTFGWGKLVLSNPTMLDVAKQTPLKNLVIYIDSGSPKDNYQVTLQMRDILQKKGYLFGLNLQHWVEVGAIHNEKAWNNRLFRPLTFLFSWKKF